MLDAGARGYLLKNTSHTEILEAIEQVANGQTYYCQETAKKLLRQASLSKREIVLKNPSIRFSALEIRIMRLISSQYTTKQIAEQLGVGIRTIEVQSKQLKEKTGALNLVGIALFAIKNGIVSLEDI